jgi:hypothetical protein
VLKPKIFPNWRKMRRNHIVFCINCSKLGFPVPLPPFRNLENQNLRCLFPMPLFVFIRIPGCLQNEYVYSNYSNNGYSNENFTLFPLANNINFIEIWFWKLEKLSGLNQFLAKGKKLTLQLNC